MARLRLAAALVGTAALAGCSLAPAYKPPVIPAPAVYKEAGPWQPARPAVEEIPADWWRILGDPALDALEQKIASDNPNLAAALARTDQARAYLVQAKAAALPQVGLDADLTRNRQSDHRPLRGSSQPSIYSADTIEGSIDFDLDLWGRIRNGIRAGKADAVASADDAAAIRLSLQAQLASAYALLRGLDEQADLLASTVDAYAQADTLTQNRFKGGIADALDTGRSGALLGEAQAQLADIKAQRAQTEHAIASLVGQPASSFSIPAAPTQLTLPALPAGVPSTLLERRPDIAAAERRMFAANARIGVAKAAFFPSLSLGGSGGFQNTGVPGLLTSPNILWSIGPSLMQPLFDGGRRRGQLAAARAEWTESTADYRAQVLKAFQDVEDALALLHHLGDEAAAENRAMDQAALAERTAMNRFTKGAVNYLDVVTAQTTALRIRQTAIALRTRRLQATVRLMAGVGGGWSRNAVTADGAPTPLKRTG